MNVTLTWVADEHREYDTNYGRKAAFRVRLEDGTIGEVTTNSETLQKRMEQFRGFIGKPTELIVEDGGKWDDGGAKPVKVKLPQQQSEQTSKRDYVPRYVDTEAGWREADERIDRRRALELAQASGVSITTDLATKFYDWLRETAQSRSATASPAGATDSPAPVVAGSEAGASAPVAGEQESGLPPDQGAPSDGFSKGEGPTGGAPAYLSKDEQAALKKRYGSPVKAINAYKEIFPEVRSLGDITVEMRDDMEGASA